VDDGLGAIRDLLLALSPQARQALYARPPLREAVLGLFGTLPEPLDPAPPPSDNLVWSTVP
jgi:hypothetical protein